MLLGVILDIVALAILAMFGRRRQRAARAQGAPAGPDAPAPRAAPPRHADNGERTMASKRTHHKHSSTKGYRRLLDRLADHPDVHRVATGRVTPRMGAGRPVAPISKVRPVASGLSITINTDGAIDRRLRRHRPPRGGRGVHGRAGLDATVIARRARGARARRRRAPRARAATAARACPGRSCCAGPRRDRAARARRCRDGSVLDLGDQRQDDDRGARGVDLRRAPASRRCTTSPARTWPGGVASALLRAPAPTRGSGSSRSTSSGSRTVAAALAPRAIVLGNLFRDQLDRYGELETIGERWAALAAARRDARSC